MEVSERIEGLLEELLDTKEEEIYNLERKVEELERQLDAPNWEWMRHEEIEEGADDLPVPRLELRYIAKGRNPSRPWYDYLAAYGLVYKHFLGHSVRIPLGATKISGGGEGPRKYPDGRRELPFREGAHISSDHKHLGLPVYIVIEPAGEEFPEKVVEEWTPPKEET